jgi:hypothetical protein
MVISLWWVDILINLDGWMPEWYLHGFVHLLIDSHIDQFILALQNTLLLQKGMEYSTPIPSLLVRNAANLTHLESKASKFRNGNKTI